MMEGIAAVRRKLGSIYQVPTHENVGDRIPATFRGPAVQLEVLVPAGEYLPAEDRMKVDESGGWITRDARERRQVAG